MAAVQRLVRSSATRGVPAPVARVLMRPAAALVGIALLAPVLFLEMFSGDVGWTPGLGLALLLVGGPCGAFLYFARTGRWSWGSLLVVPLLALAQAAAVLSSVARFPHSPAAHLASAVAASWLVALTVHTARTRPLVWKHPV